MPTKPRPRPTPAETSLARAERRLRSLEEPLDVRRSAHVGCPTFEVRNPIHRTSYLVFLPESPAPTPALCSCSDFARRGLGTCKHLEAATQWVRDHLDEPTPAEPVRGSNASAVWEEIDRRLTGRPAGRPGRVQEWARVGAALFERSPGDGSEENEGKGSER